MDAVASEGGNGAARLLRCGVLPEPTYLSFPAALAVHRLSGGIRKPSRWQTVDANLRSGHVAPRKGIEYRANGVGQDWRLMGSSTTAWQSTRPLAGGSVGGGGGVDDDGVDDDGVDDGVDDGGEGGKARERWTREEDYRRRGSREERVRGRE